MRADGARRCPAAIGRGHATSTIHALALVAAAFSIACDKSDDTPRATATSSSSPRASAGEPPNPVAATSRKAIDCAAYLELLGKHSTAGATAESRPGEWGGLDAAFRKLPEGAELCGATFIVMQDGTVQDKTGSLVTVYIRSALDKAALESHYGGLATANGCNAGRGDERTQSWTCPSDKGTMLSLLVLPDYRIYAVSGLLP